MFYDRSSSGRQPFLAHVSMPLPTWKRWVSECVSYHRSSSVLSTRLNSSSCCSHTVIIMMILLNIITVTTMRIIMTMFTPSSARGSCCWWCSLIYVRVHCVCCLAECFVCYLFNHLPNNGMNTKAENEWKTCNAFLCLQKPTDGWMDAEASMWVLFSYNRYVHVAQMLYVNFRWGSFLAVVLGNRSKDVWTNILTKLISFGFG